MGSAFCSQSIGTILVIEIPLREEIFSKSTNATISALAGTMFGVDFPVALESQKIRIHKSVRAEKR
jgi:hypothetical protein